MTNLDPSLMFAAAVAGLGGYLIGGLQKARGQLLRLLRNRFVASAHVPDRGSVYAALETWLASHPGMARCNNLEVLGVERPKSDAPPGPQLQANGSETVTFGDVEATRILYGPARGTHVLKHDGRRFLLGYERTESNSNSPERRAYTVTAFGRGCRAAVEALVAEAYAASNLDDGATVEVSTPAGSQWRFARKLPARPLGSIVLRAGQMEAIVGDLERFLAAEAWHRRLGLPYRFSMLLYGPPGGGKSSLAAALAAHFRRPVHSMSILGDAPEDYTLRNLFSELPDSAILLMEDVDRGIELLQDPSKSDRPRASFSTLLNLLDGAASAHGRITILTANEPDKLDPALLRPGRVDRKYLLVEPDADMAARLFLRFFPGEEALAVTFGHRVEANPALNSMARLQRHLADHRDDPIAAAGAVERDVVALPTAVRVARAYNGWHVRTTTAGGDVR